MSFKYACEFCGRQGYYDRQREPRQFEVCFSVQLDKWCCLRCYLKHTEKVR